LTAGSFRAILKVLSAIEVCPASASSLPLRCSSALLNMRRILVFFVIILFVQGCVFAATTRKKTRKRTPAKTASAQVHRPARSASKKHARPATVKNVRYTSPRTPLGVNPSGPWKEPTFIEPAFDSDHIDGEDLAVRRAAVSALGSYNGTVVVSDPLTGRVLTMVNQRLALKGGFQPCSTIKLVTALAAMNEGIITRENKFRLSKTYRMDLSMALARSNNYYFATLGQRLGFEKVNRYARLLGLGERAGWNIPGEEPGVLPAVAPKNGGVGMMTSFGEGIRLTPLELASLLGAIANGGTQYQLQHPRSAAELVRFAPRVKRQLGIGQHTTALKDGMRGALLYGTARRAGALTDDPVFGKTGTCTDAMQASHMGWFGAFNEAGGRKLVVVVMLTGGKAVNGPVASGIAGNVYKNLADSHYLSAAPTFLQDSIVSTQKCCATEMN
jgi:beta-lactamase class D